jgi:hypothetical protein
MVSLPLIQKKKIQTKRLILLTACWILFASAAHAEYLGSPSCSFYATKPMKPYSGFTSQAEIDEYNWKVDAYNSSRSDYIQCIEDYVKAHRKAANDAIDEANLRLSY